MLEIGKIYSMQHKYTLAYKGAAFKYTYMNVETYNWCIHLVMQAQKLYTL